MSRSNADSAGRHISQIETIWPVLMKAHAGSPSEVNAAQQAVLLRYHQPVYRYLLACLKDRDGADEVYQEFALRFVRGDFKNANPEKGRFRDLLKSALYHLVVDHHKRRWRAWHPLPADAPEPAADTMAESDRQFLDAWRADLLNKAWDGLAEDERQTARPLYTVLHFRAGHPDLRSHQIAELLGARLGKELSAEWVRKWLYTGRDRFAELLLAEVSASLRDATPDAVEQELLDLSLFEYCRSALERWRQRGGGPGS
jgi:RNA polymerase sigma-70 factor (ECF subfamily)